MRGGEARLDVVMLVTSTGTPEHEMRFLSFLVRSMLGVPFIRFVFMVLICCLPEV